MNTAPEQDKVSDKVSDKTGDNDQREALAESERRASEAQPENFKESETGEKIVEIGPELTNAPIEGIDPLEDADDED